MNKTNWNSNLYLWRPKEKIKNRIRIMPGPEDSKGDWWMRADIHVVQTIYQRYQRYICNRQLFNVSCKLCNMKKRLKRQDKPKEAEKIVLRRYGFLNIIDRAREAEGVKVWMAPISAWNRIRHLYFKEDNPEEYFDIPPDEKRYQDRWSYGHDSNVFYDPEEEPFHMYYVEPNRLDDKPTPLGTEEQRKIWASQVLPLLPENYYDPVELKDKELKLLEKGIAELVSHEEFMAYIRTPEYEAEMEPMREEKERKKVEEEQARIEQIESWEKARKEWEEMIRSGEAAEEIIKEKEVCIGGETYIVGEDEAWDYLNELFYEKEDWGELKGLLNEQVRKLKGNKKRT